MRLAVDARMMGAGKTRGIGRYIQEMVDQMRPLLAPGDEIVLIDRPIPWYSLKEQYQMPGIVRAAKADLVWIPHWNVSIFMPKPFVITIHDLLLLEQPSSAKASTRGPVVSWLKRIGHRIVLSLAVRRAEKILVPTRAVAHDIKKYFPFAGNKVIVTGEGLSRFPHHETDDRLPATSYLLYVGSAYPHKRLDLLIDAWSIVSKSRADLSLVITGSDDVFLARIKKQVDEHRIPRVLFTGAVDDQTLANLYAHAQAFIFPSSFEGFGLPPIEALAHGTPVIASDLPVLREVLPEQGVFFFKTGDKDAMIAATNAVLANLKNARAQAALGGAEVRRRHRWDRAAEQVLHALHSVAHHH